MIEINEKLSISEDEITEDFIRSSGPGGQNVNKVSTAVQLRFDAANSPNLPEDVKRRLKNIAGHRMTTEGVLLITARRLRTREENRKDALDRLVSLIGAAAEKPKPRIKTKATKASKERKLESKKIRGRTKRMRKPLKGRGED